MANSFDDVIRISFIFGVDYGRIFGDVLKCFIEIVVFVKYWYFEFVFV